MSSNKKWCYATDEYRYVCCRRWTRFGAWWHGLWHLTPGRVMRYDEWQARKKRMLELEYGMESPWYD